jgi:hypothetical protein
MMLRMPIALSAAFFSLIGQATAQNAQIDHTLTWTEVDAQSGAAVATPNGLIEPGEGALVRLSVSFTPVGQSVAYPGGVAPVAGYRSSAFKLEALNANGGSWTHLAAPPGFRVELLPPPVAPDGTLIGAGSTQSWAPHPWTPDPTNPFDDVWQGVWVPASYDTRQVSFTMRPMTPIVGPPIPCLLWVFDGIEYREATAVPTWDSVQIPVVPAPGALAVLGCAALFNSRRRRA